MRFLFSFVLVVFCFQVVNAQYDNSEKLSILGGALLKETLIC